MSQSTRDGLEPSSPRGAMRLLPWGILIFGGLLSLVLALTLARHANQTSADRFEDLARQLDRQIEARLQANIQILRGGQSLWRATGDVDRDQWRRYVDTLQLPLTYPGIQGMGFATVLQPGEVAAAEARVRAEAAAQTAELRPHFERYAIHPPGARPLYAAITLLEPLAGRNLRAFGFDMYSEPVRREALERARDTGEPAMSGHVRLVQETDTDVQPGFLVYLPVYRGEPRTVAARRAALRGFVYSPFRSYDLMRTLVAARGEYVQFAIYDGDSQHADDLIFHSQPQPAFTPPPGVVHVSPLLIAGHRWTVVARPGPFLVSAADRVLPPLVGAGGAVVTLLATVLAHALVRTRRRARELARRMTADLKRRELALEALSRELARSNEDLQQFAYAVSHDLKEPLRTISTSLGLVAQRAGERLDPVAREFLGYAKDSARRLAEMIEQLLAYSRAQHEPPAHERVDLAEAARRAARDLDALVRDSGATIDVQALPVVHADAAQMARVFQNLFSNAIKYAERSGRPPRIRVCAEPVEHGWTVRVEDNGIGIAPEHQQRIFMPFKRLHSRDEYEGSGLGLATCKRILQRYGGDIWVEQGREQGSAFCFRLPPAKETAAA